MKLDPSRLSRRRFTHAVLAAPLLARGVPSRPAEGEIDDPIGAAVAHPDRSPGDRARDGTRKPARVLDFFDIKRGMRVADIQAGDGYYTEILSRAVGPAGHVWCQNNQFPLRFVGPVLDPRLADDRLPNVTRLDRELDDPGLPKGLDAAILIRFYHDFGWMELDREAFNDLVFRLLKPGGVFGVVDHHALAGAGISEGQRLHRIEASLVREEIESAGFVLEAESYVLRNPDDTRDWNIFDDNAKNRDNTDRFAFLFRKPE